MNPQIHYLQSSSGEMLSGKKLPLPGKILFSSVVLMALAALIFVGLYRHSQISEFQAIAEHEHTQILTSLESKFNDEFYEFISSTYRFDTQSLGRNKKIYKLFSMIESGNGGRWLKFKLYDRSGRTIFSSARDEIGQPSNHQELVHKALLGEASHRIELHDTFHSVGGNIKDVYVASSYMPLSYLGNRVGVIEICSDNTQAFNSMPANAAMIALLIAVSFAMLLWAVYLLIAQNADQKVAK